MWNKQKFEYLDKFKAKIATIQVVNQELGRCFLPNEFKTKSHASVPLTS